MHNWDMNGYWVLLIEFIWNLRDLSAQYDVTELVWGITRHFKGCAMLVLIRFGIVLPNRFLQVAQKSHDSLRSINRRYSRTMMKEIFCMHTMYEWEMLDFGIFIGPSMVMHGPITSFLDFIWNKIISNLNIMDIISKKFGRLNKLGNYSLQTNYR